MQTIFVVYRDNLQISAIFERYFRWNDISAIYRRAIVLTTARYGRYFFFYSFELSDVSFELSDISFFLNDISFELSDISFELSDISFKLRDISLPPNDISFKLSDISFASVRYRHG